MWKFLSNIFADWTGHDSIAALLLFAWVGTAIGFGAVGKDVPNEIRDLGVAAFGYLFRGAVGTLQQKVRDAVAVTAKADVP